MKIFAGPGSILFFLLLSFALQAAEKAIPVSVVSVAIAPVYDEIPLTGSVSARRLSRISPKVDGFVSQMLVDAGDVVKSGAILLHLDPVMAKIGLARAHAQVDEASATLDEAKRQRQESAELVKKKHVPATNFESRVADVQIKSAVLKRLQAELEQAQETLTRHTVYAPFDGVVAKKEVEIGEWVETGTSLIELVEISVLRIDVPVPQTYFSRITQGTPVTMKFDAFPERGFDAVVSIKIPIGNASTRTFPIRIEMNNDEGLIAPGMSARVRIKLREADKVMLLPRDAIVRKPDGSETIWQVIDDAGRKIARPLAIESGRAYRDNVEVIARDLQVGDKVVIRGNEILQADQAVQVVAEHKLQF